MPEESPQEELFEEQVFIAAACPLCVEISVLGGLILVVVLLRIAVDNKFFT